MEISKQPRFTFSENESEQKEQLKSNVLMEQYRTYREANKNDIFNPSYHFWAPDGRINDPNGFCFWNGKYHLFYQQYPPVFPRQHWGHAVSADMVHWEDLPTAIYPDIEKACFSGNTLVEKDRVVAMYYGLGIGNMIAFSHDPLLLNWEKHPNDPVIPHLPDLPESGLPYRIYDPFLWKEKEGYYALSGTQSNGIMKEHLFFSQDLGRWTYLGPLMDENPHVECANDGACPYFLPFGENQHILLFFSHSSGTRALIGPYDKITHKFSPKKSMKFSQDSVAVSSLVAPCAISDGNGGVYVIYNMGECGVSWKPRRGAFSLMRHLYPEADGSICIKPVKQTESLRVKELLNGSVALEAFQTERIGASGKRLEIEAEIHMGGARSVEFRVLCDPNGKEYTTVSIARGKNGGIPCGYVTIDTSHSSLYPDGIGRIPDSTKFEWDGNTPIQIRIFVDNCMTEVFVNERAALCQMSYASLPESDGVTAEALGGNATIENIRVWEMGSIY